MTIEQIDTWAKKLGEAWVVQDPDKAMELVSKTDIAWYENPLEPPLTNWDDVYKLWGVVPHNQKDVSFTYKVIACSENYGIINWQAKLTKVPSNVMLEIDGVFQIMLDKNGLCTYFKQWEVERTIK